MGTLVTDEDREDFLRRNVHVTDEQIENAKNCTQGGEDWHKARKHRIGQSTIGYIAGHPDKTGKVKTWTDCAVQMLWPKEYEKKNFSEFGEEAKRYGTVMEDAGLAIMQIVVKEHFQQLGYKDVWVQSTGTWIWKEYPWLTASSDGLIYATGGPPEKPMVFGTAENKCPAGKAKKIYEKTPHIYGDQFTGTAIIVKAEFIIFNVYTPTKTQVNWYDIEDHREYWMTEVFPKAQKFYFEEYLDRAILQERGLLEEGTISVRSVIFKEITPVKGTKKEQGRVDLSNLTSNKMQLS